MRLSIRSGAVALLLAGTMAFGRVLEENQGQDDLERATEVKLTGTTLSDLDEVIRLCQSALQKGLDEDNAQFARQLLAATRIERGTRYARDHLSKFPLDPEWRKDRRLALEDLEKGVAFDPQQPHALYRIAQLHLLPGGNLKRAAEALDEAIRLSTEEPRLRASALVLRARLRKEPEKRLADLDEAVRTNPRDAAVLRARGAVYADQEKYELALADFQSAIQLDPHDASTHQDRARTLIELKRYEEALESLNKARQLAPKAVGPLIEESRAYGLQSKFDAALEALQQAYLLEPGNPLVLLLRASVYQELGKHDEALEDVDNVLELRPGLPEAIRLRAMLLAQAGKFDLAATQMEELQKPTSDDNLHTAVYYSRGGRPRKAIDKLSVVLEGQPDHPMALHLRGDALLGIGKQAEAIADYEKALKLQPDDTGVLNNLAWVLATSPDETLRDGKRAIELAVKACELTEYKEAHILSTLAAGYAETGDFDTAIKWSQKAVELGKDDQLEQLTEELESYRAKKPFRELLTGPESEPPEPTEPKKPEKPKPEPTSEPPEPEKPAAS